MLESDRKHTVSASFSQVTHFGPVSTVSLLMIEQCFCHCSAADLHFSTLRSHGLEPVKGMVEIDPKLSNEHLVGDA